MEYELEIAPSTYCYFEIIWGMEATYRSDSLKSFYYSYTITQVGESRKDVECVLSSGKQTLDSGEVVLTPLKENKQDTGDECAYFVVVGNTDEELDATFFFKVFTEWTEASVKNLIFNGGLALACTLGVIGL
mmetsp:Transcript_32388/g.31681  ORF Transcript_32388/g.31681 Transcript_32388/m.31681 type:complete len:132 (-) Transcript_32388:49-444(-)